MSRRRRLRQHFPALRYLPKSFLQSLILFAIVLFWANSNSLANGTDADSFLDKLEKQREKVDTYAAQFVQKKTLAIFDEEKTSTGTLLYKAPHQMIWKYDTPDNTQMRIDRYSVSFYFPKLEQIEIYPSAKEKPTSPFFFAFEATGGEIEESFDISVVESGADQLTRVELFPRSDPLASELRSIILWLGEPDYLPRRILIRETSGDTTEINLCEVRVNEPIADEELKFDAPEGTEVFEAEPGAF